MNTDVADGIDVRISGMTFRILTTTNAWRDMGVFDGAFKRQQVGQGSSFFGRLSLRQALELLYLLRVNGELYTGGSQPPQDWAFGKACLRDAHRLAKSLRDQHGIKPESVLNSEWRPAFSFALRSDR